MGLDCTAYSKAVVTEHRVDEWCDVDGHEQAFAYKGFEASFRGLADAELTFSGEFIGGRCYDIRQATRFAFCAGSYGGYNAFRTRLAKVFLEVDPREVWNRPGKYAELPFFELINFADNEGCIGPEAALDLYGDFVAHRDAWRAACADDTYSIDLDRYENWLKACELAADSGFIDFH